MITEGKIREVNKKRFEKLCTAIADSLTLTVGIDKDSESEINSVLVDAEKEVIECQKAVTSMQEITSDIHTVILPTLETNELEFEKLFSIIETMEQLVVPALSDDLNALEALVTTLEKKRLPRESPTTINSWLSLISNSNDSNDEVSELAPEFELHRASDLIGNLLQCQRES